MSDAQVPGSVAMSAAADAPDGKFPLLLTASLVSSLIMLDSNIVSVSLPTIARSLSATFTEIQWVISSYVLTYAALLMAAGNYGDRSGRRRAMLQGLVVFGVASGLCGMARSSWVLNLARAAQGVGGALLLTASLALITSNFSGPARTRAFAFWGASLGIALAVGPIAGGIITRFFGWRWIFLVNIPICVGLIYATFRYIAESKDPDAKRLDFAGIGTFSIGLALTIWALIEGNDAGWASPTILVRLGVAAALFVAFVLVELRQVRPMVDFGLFRRPTFLGSVFAMIGYGASAQVMVFFLPSFLQNAYGFEPLIAGVAMIPFALPMVLAPRFTTKLSQHLSGRALLTSGLVIAAIGNVAFWQVARSGAGYVVFALAMVVAGCGAGLLNGMTVKVMGGAVPPERAGMASGLASTTRFIGILMSVAGLGAVLSEKVRSSFVAAATQIGFGAQEAEAAAKHVEAGDLAGALHAVPDGMRAQLHQIGLAAFGDGFAVAALIATVVAVFAAVLTVIYVRRADTAPAPIPKAERPCATIDCRDPL
jgi:EmrB/QacA subfamily drug resistance transporter